MPDNLLGPPPTRLPVDPAAAPLEQGADLRTVATAYPSSALVWSLLSEESLLAGDVIEAYAFARTGYHRSLDALRRAGWRGQGPVPWSHEPNRGFLRSLAALSRAAGAINESEEQERCAQFLRDSSPEAADHLEV